MRSLGLLLVLPACASSVSAVRTPQVERILALEDARALRGGELANTARTDPSPEVRARALLALGRIQSPASLEALTLGLRDGAPQVRAEAAFSLGLLALSWVPLSGAAKDTVASALTATLAEEPQPEVRERVLEALGRVATPAAGEALEKALGGPQRAQAALSLGRAAKLGLKLSPAAFGALTPMVAAGQPVELRYGAAYALAQSKAPEAHAALLGCAKDLDPETRALCLKGLGDQREGDDSALLGAALDDPDWRAAAEAARALAKRAGACSATCPAMTKLQAPLVARLQAVSKGASAAELQPLLALAQQGLPRSGLEVMESLRLATVAARVPGQSPQVHRDLANLECRLAAMEDRATGELSLTPACGGGLVPEARRLALGLHELARAAGGDPAKRWVAVAPYLSSREPWVQSGALDAIAELGLSSAAEDVRPLLQAKDPVLVAGAISALAKLKDREAIPALKTLAAASAENLDLALSLADALAELKAKDAAPELEAMLHSSNAAIRAAASDALGRLSGQAPAVPDVEGAVASVPAALAPSTQLHLHTVRGEIVVQLDTEDSFRTAANLVGLARKGFFKNLTFHRIVPDFVAQGGDPHGDGEGGPGYSIRCEIGHRPYTRGTVGMALSGKDTGGSQFFITHTRQPHLDGRYATVGQVVQGLELVDQLLEGDAIDDVTVTE
ncbi:MAG: peptidylprolyl isomerase [Myxococcaceae bacterium]|nr:peptidylprolyl isomerase [Myxococcaceae bacterium]